MDVKICAVQYAVHAYMAKTRDHLFRHNATTFYMRTMKTENFSRCFSDQTSVVETGES